MLVLSVGWNLSIDFNEAFHRTQIQMKNFSVKTFAFLLSIGLPVAMNKTLIY